MPTITQARLPQMTQNAGLAPDTVLEPRWPLRARSDTSQGRGVLLSTFHNPVIWTAIGILSASWTEYTCQRISVADRRQWQTEWISWAVLFAVAQVALFLRNRQVYEAAGEEARPDSDSLTLGRLNVLAVAVANAVAHSLWLYFRPRGALPLVTVTTSFALYLSTKYENHIPRSDPECPITCPTNRPYPPADSRRSLNVAIAAAIPSTILWFAPQATEPGLPSLPIQTTAFLFSKTIIYIGLSTHLFSLPNKGLLSYPVNLLRSLSLNSAVLWTVVLMAYGGLPTTPIDLWTTSLVLARVLEWMAVISVSLNWSTTSATIISTVGVGIGQSFARSTIFGTSQVSIVTAIGILHAIYSLPSRLPGRKYLAFFLILPAWSFLVHIPVTSTERPVTYYGPLHPIEKLVADTRTNFEQMVERQSKTLPEAVAEYRRRYKRSPPPHFDLWYDMATKDGVITLIDEFDTLMAPIQPFWGIPPNVLRERVESSFEGRRIHRFDIREHEWHTKSTDTGRYAYVGDEMKTWLKLEHLRLLPDMTWALNFWDEPRVYAPYDTVQHAMSRAFEPVPSINRGPATKGQHTVPTFHLKSEVGFLKLEHRDAWEAMSVACPVVSPARSSETPSSSSADAPSAAMAFMSNKTADMDLCAHPDLAKSHGFVLAPAAFDLTHTLFPLFSGGVPNMASDIIYPPAYTGKRLTAEGPVYDPSRDIEWDAKRPSIYWKGSSTGGWATAFNWRQLHRQRLSLKFTNASSSHSMVTLLKEPVAGVSEGWDAYEAPLSDLASRFDIHIAGELVLCSSRGKGHAEMGGCQLEKHGLEIAELGSAEEAWAHKYVLDIDGNGYSGRFLRLLMSNSVPVKMTVFREWFNDWIIPWAHYIPARPDEEFSDLPEILRYLTSERGDRLGKEIAELGQKWTKRVVTKDSLRLWFLRLLMEYGRVVNDNRDDMNFIA